MSKRFEDYLGKVGRELRHLPATVREAEVREMRSHLEQLREDFVSQGQDSDAAAQAATARFGDARAVGIKVRDAWEGRNFSWRSFLLAFWVGLCPWVPALVLSSLVENYRRWPDGAASHFHTLINGTGFALLMGAPLLSGMVHGFYLGRRAWMMNVVIYGLLWGAEVIFHRPPSLTLWAFETSFWAWALILGVGSACSLDWMLRQKRRKNLVRASEIGA